jgi:medium-chain acyl-[acyl-carrier-protein] hydrolase
MAAVGVRNDSAHWFKRFRQGGRGDVRLFCFHHAGGTASVFRTWPRQLPRSVEPIAVQLPGRADRFREPPLDAMAPLVDTLVEVMEPLLDQPFALCGLSMGAKVAWALSHRLRDHSLPAPTVLFVASAAAPAWHEGRANWNTSDDDLIAYLRAMGETPPELFSEPQLLAALLPTLRADLTLVDTFRMVPATPLAVPIRGFAGIDDPEGTPERMRGWATETSGRFDLDVVSGGHLFDTAGELQVIRTISAELDREPARPHPNGVSSHA